MRESSGDAEIRRFQLAALLDQKGQPEGIARRRFSSEVRRGVPNGTRTRVESA